MRPSLKIGIDIKTVASVHPRKEGDAGDSR